MRKRYLKIFNNLEEYNEKKDDVMGYPHVIVLENTKEIIYCSKIDYSKECFTIEALEDGLTVYLSRNASHYRVDGGEWINLTANTATPSINSGQKISFKITNPTISSSYGIGSFIVNDKAFNVEGNIMSLLYGDNFEGQIDLSGKNYAFYKLFQYCTTLKNAENLILPATTLANYCYYYMFMDCTSLTIAPELPATTLATYCYSNMFKDCTGLTTASTILPATKLAEDCYSGMFQSCTSLTTSPQLPATKLAEDCYSGMFSNCTSLTNAPELPATTLANYCYSGMFSNCTSLTNAPELPATTLAENCYQSMFSGCTGLTEAPKLLPATTLAKSCYYSMFQSCRGLTSAPQLPATTLAERCYYSMFQSCRGLTTAPQQLPATTLANYCYSGMFSNCTSLTNAPELPATTLAESCYNDMFYDCTGLTEAPKLLPATTLAKSCYHWMFRDCTGLTTAPTLPATKLAEDCYSGMFRGCTSLTTSPQLPATTLAKSCYNEMFNGCTSLTTAPQQLPATTLANYCYSGMFNGCTSLTNAPELPATTLAESCYSSMFQSCRGLTSAPQLPATTLAKECYSSMFNGCTGLTTAPQQLPATTLAERCYQYMFSGCRGLTNAPELPATILLNYCYYYMFYNCSKLNYIKMLATYIGAFNCLYNWVSGVASSGTFVKNSNMTTLPSGTSGIPTRWAVESHIVPYIINKSNEALTFYYTNGLYTPPTTISAPLTNSFTQNQLLSFKPNCDITVSILNVKNDYTWVMNKTLQTVMSELGISNVSKLEIIINSVIIPEEDSYYGYGETYEWNGETVIDLGLPSGTLWATCNVGASTPWEDGNYYAYGETKTKTVYNFSTYTYTGDASTLPLENDAAYVNMGSGYHIPTREQCQELIDNTISSWVNINGRNGNWFKSKINGKSIFIPASGKYVNYIYDVNDRMSILLSTGYRSGGYVINNTFGGMYGNNAVLEESAGDGNTVRAVFN